MRTSTWVPLAAVVAVVAALALLLAGGGTGAEALTNCEIGATDIALDAAEQDFLAAVNAERTALGLVPVAPSDTLNRAAAWKSADQLSVGGLSHTDSLKRDYAIRVHDCGYPRGGYLGEITLVGASTGQRAFDLFKSSPSHYNTMVHPSFRYIGIGKAGPYWTGAFGSVADGATTPPIGNPSSSATATATASQAATPSPTASPTPSPTPTPTPTPAVPLAGIQLGLSAGPNIVTYGGPIQPAGAALRSLEGKVLGAYRWDPLAQRWLRWAPGVPGYAAEFTHFEPGQSYFIRLSSDGLWSY